MPQEPPDLNLEQDARCWNELRTTLREPPSTALFVPLRVQTVVLPHPYELDVVHQGYLARYWRTKHELSDADIRDSEAHGGRCDTCRLERRAGKRVGLLDYDDHRAGRTLVVGLRLVLDPKLVPGLDVWIKSCREFLKRAEIKGFRFVTSPG